MWQTEVLPFLSQEERMRRYVPRGQAQFSRRIHMADRKALTLKFQLLPLEKFHNVNTLRARRRFSLSVHSVMVHCGWVLLRQSFLLHLGAGNIDSSERTGVPEPRLSKLVARKHRWFWFGVWAE
jgi:hypothetical protein